MKKLQILAVLILSLFFVVSCVSDEDDDEDFWNNDQTDTAPDGNSDTTGDTLPDTPTEPTESTDPTVEPTTDPTTEPTTEPTTDPTTDPTNPTDPTDPTEPEQTPEEKCLAANGTWNANNTCTKTADCTEKPANTEWNGESSYTQTYANGAWSAATATEYSETEGVCHYKCTDSYFWNGSSCVNPCNPDPCGSNAEPDSCEASDATTYTCGCVDGYHWENDGCADNTKTVYCTLPAHAHWNAGTTPTVEQSWTSNEGWPPSPEGVYDPERTDGCYFSCDDDSHWEEASGKCELNMPVCAKGSATPCIDPEYGYIWSYVNPDTQTWSKAVEWCSNLEEGGYQKGTWKLPTIDQLRTLVKECPKTKYAEEYGEGTCKVSDPFCLNAYSTACYSSTDCSCNADDDGGHSKFGETLLLWSNSSASTDTAWRLLFSNASIASGSKYVSDARARCVYVPENN